jgi:hypothetical protein
MMNVMIFVMGPLGILATAWLPAAVTFYFATTAALGCLQGVLFLQPWFRRYAGLPQLPKVASPTLTGAASNPWKEMKTSFNEQKEKWTEKTELKERVNKEKRAAERRQFEDSKAMWTRLKQKNRR